MTNDRATIVAAANDGDRAAAAEKLAKSTRGVIPASLAADVLVHLAAGFIVTSRAPGLGGMALVAASSAVSLLVLVPMVLGISAAGTKRSLEQLAQSMASERQMRAESRRREFETRLANALEMADTEIEVMRAAGRAFRHASEDACVEVLLADNSHAHLERTLAMGPGAEANGCGVESPDRCVAARRGQTQVFNDSENLDACPQLQGRQFGRCCAVCVPVSITGRSIGVVHRASPLVLDDGSSTDRERVDELEVVATQLGARLAMLRVMSETQLQASTDGLTGLPNRRNFENRVRLLRQSGIPFTVVMTDLDRFKDLNDTHGHEAGDRALRIFAGVLRATLRSVDIMCRYGGEEFMVVLPGCDVTETEVVCARIREALAAATMSGDTPRFTASFGVMTSQPDLTLEQLIMCADSALYEAKRGGRDRAVVYDPDSELAAAPGWDARLAACNAEQLS
jgi:diguanylate cyclase (GGDEF)-like protein